jgi:hypothetical protein
MNTSAMVTLYVGSKSGKGSHVHKDFACHHSSVFHAAFTTNNFLEGQTQTYVLQNTTEPVVRLLVHWMYTEQLDISESESAKPNSSEDLSLVQLWILADKLLIPRLQF